MKRMAIAALLIAALGALVVPAAAQEELTGSVTTGTLAAGERLAFTLDATEGEFYVVSVVSEDFDTFVNITGPNDIPVTGDDDSGRSSNSLAAFIARSSGAYTVEVSSFSSSSSGDFTLAVASGATELTVGTPLSVTAGDGEISVYQFEAPEGAVNIVADSGGSVDTSLMLVNSNGVMIDDTDDDLGVDPAFQRIVLDGGVYFLVLSPYNAEIAGDVSLNITTTETRTLGEEPLTFAFNEASREDVATFDVVAGTVYAITVTSTGEAGDFSMYIEPADEKIFSFANFSFTSGLSGTFLYVPDVTGVMRANISGGFYSSDEQDEFTITLVEQAQ